MRNAPAAPFQVQGAARPGAATLALLLAAGVGAVSCGAIFARLAEAPPLAIAAYRVVVSTVVFTPFVLHGPVRELRSLDARGWLGLALAGAALAVHFGLWIASLGHTTVAASVLLVDTTPFFVGVASRFLLGRRPSGWFWVGLAVAFTGGLAIFRSGSAAGTLRGNLLALGGAAAMAGYLLAGARARPRLSLLAYVWPVYGAAGLLLAGACVATGTPLAGFSRRTYVFLLLAGLVPQSIGHTTYNWSLRWLEPGVVALASLAEPVVSSALAHFILGERLTHEILAGGTIVLAGIYLATRKGAAEGPGQ